MASELLVDLGGNVGPLGRGSCGGSPVLGPDGEPMT